jgi:cell wall-associated NlpC family hydrolase
MNRWIAGGVLLGGVLLAGGAAAAPEAPRVGVVLTSVEDMYAAPDAGTNVVSQALLGQRVKVLERRDGFVNIETPDGYPGWAREAAVFTYPVSATSFYAGQGQVAEVTSLMANVYRDPDVTTARPRVLAPLGARLELFPTPSDERWLGVRLPAGERGFVQKGDVRLVDAAAPRPRGSEQDLIATARRFLGVPYLWGGMSQHGVDCSGFVSRVYHVNGVDLLRDADMQFGDPRALVVERADLRPGDLLFFGKKKITHVGMYLGGGRFIHATTHEVPVVQESVLDEPYWTGLFQGARRPR